MSSCKVVKTQQAVRTWSTCQGSEVSCDTVLVDCTESDMMQGHEGEREITML